MFTSVNCKKIVNFLKPVLLVFFLVSVSSPASASSQKFVAVSCGGDTTIALDENGSVWLWGRVYDQAGSPAYNQFPDQYVQCIGDTYYRVQPSPMQLPLSDVIATSGGNLALKKDGTVWAWGRNGRGQLGDGTNVSTSTPVKVKGLDHVIAISSENLNCLALKSDGTAWAWGQNDCGQVGDGTLIDRWEPVQVKGLSNATAIYGGAFAVKDDGTVWTWGTTILDVDERGKPIDYWVRGLHKDNCKPTPFQVEGIKNVRAIDAASTVGVVFVKDDGTVWSWGYDIWGRLGNGSIVNPLTTPDIQFQFVVTPVQAKGLTNVKAVLAGGLWSMALKEDGAVWVWGYNYGGQFGTGERNNTEALPVKVLGLDGVVAIDGKDSYAVFLKKDGSVWACGNLYDDVLVSTPMKILGPDSESIVPTITPDPTTRPIMSDSSQANSSDSAINASATPVQNNVPLNAMFFGSLAIVLTTGCIAYLFVLRKR